MSLLVLVGAGGLGRKIARVSPPVAFIDGDPALVGMTIQGVPVLTFDETRKLYPDATYCVTIWGAASSHRIAQTENVLRNGGVRDLIPFAVLLRRAGLSHYFIGPTVTLNNAGLATMDGIWADKESADVWFENSESRYRGTVTNLPEPIAGPQYMAPGLFTFLGDREVVVDGGAFDGDTFRSWMAEGHEFKRWHGFEPHPANFDKFMREVYPPRNMSAYPFALGARCGLTTISTDALNSAVVGAAGISVQETTLDALGLSPTFVKLDIEGAELDALEGMRETVTRCRPVMAVCVYHKPDHLWRVPLALREMIPDAKLYLRPHGAEGWDTVCYAVPPERVGVTLSRDP